MLVLSRKADQQIRIGEDITITVVRVEGNRVRIGIDAPRDQRIVRGELEPISETIEFELSEREFAFAHQSEEAVKSSRSAKSLSRVSKDRLSGQADAAKSEPKVYSGKMNADGSKVQLKAEESNPARRSPLAGFVSAS
ncbi:carbon storage regulator [Rhodopirellula sp. MGV]|uniref:carbon storage regulator n=1 Tax=Rhodopirellula sp. MGV TaxID=2023130 RepID=UPI000B978DB1|nr:carbon storage regulator [Rhodopirellula sp. MGV]OYP38924.1 hypothetical protein CGZ80_01510 [Rhodopirellula sp. MGV]PNY37602.1 carbon storage regulator [Rhodopirellula baltica]